MLGFGLVGYFFIKIGVEPAPFVLGFVLGPMLEENFRRAMLIASGDFWVFLERPISAVLLAGSALLLAALLVPGDPPQARSSQGRVTRAARSAATRYDRRPSPLRSSPTCGAFCRRSTRPSGTHGGSGARLGAMVVVCHAHRDGGSRNVRQVVPKLPDLLEEVLPAVRLVPQHARTMLAGPIVMLTNLSGDFDLILEGQHGRQQRCPLVRCRRIEPSVHADFNAQAGGVAFVGMPADFINRKALVDALVVDREVPGHLALPSIGALLVFGVRGSIGSRILVVRVVDRDRRRGEFFSRAI